MLADLKKHQPNATLEDVKKSFRRFLPGHAIERSTTRSSNLKTLFPGYAGQGYELAGFVWFQGWNDMIDAKATAEYTSNLTHFIRDVRKDFKAPDLPFVIGQMGVDGANPNAHIQAFKAAEAAVMNDDGVQGQRGAGEDRCVLGHGRGGRVQKGLSGPHGRVEQGRQQLPVSLSGQRQDDVPDRQSVRGGDPEIARRKMRRRT